MEEIKNGHGGARKGCGRKPKNRNNKIIIRVTDEAMAVLKQQKNVTDFIEALILGSIGGGGDQTPAKDVE